MLRSKVFQSFVRPSLWALFSLLVAAQAHATVNLSVGDSHWVGFVYPNAPANETMEVEYVNYLTTLAMDDDSLVDGDYAYVIAAMSDGTDETFTRDGSQLDTSMAATAEVTGFYRQDNGNTTLDLGNNVYEYITAKYDAHNGGMLVWYFEGGISGEVILPETFYNPYTQMRTGISHSTGYNAAGSAIPEPASMIVWGLLACAGIFVVRQRGR